MDRIASWLGIKKCARSIIIGHMRIRTPDVAALNVATGGVEHKFMQHKNRCYGTDFLMFFSDVMRAHGDASGNQGQSCSTAGRASADRRGYVGR